MQTAEAAVQAWLRTRWYGSAYLNSVADTVCRCETRLQPHSFVSTEPNPRLTLVSMRAALADGSTALLTDGVKPRVSRCVMASGRRRGEVCLRRARLAARSERPPPARWRRRGFVVCSVVLLCSGVTRFMGLYFTHPCCCCSAVPALCSTLFAKFLANQLDVSRLFVLLGLVTHEPVRCSKQPKPLTCETQTQGKSD